LGLPWAKAGRPVISQVAPFTAAVPPSRRIARLPPLKITLGRQPRADASATAAGAHP